jgi:hypothetical protein
VKVVSRDRYGILDRLTAPRHPFTLTGRDNFDAMLQAAPDAIRGRLVAADATIWNSTSGPAATTY